MKQPLELPGQHRSEDQFRAEVWTLLAKRGFYNLNGRIVHVVDAPSQETQIIEVTPEYLADYINREFQTFVTGNALRK
jgi:hypothetical protein